MKTVLVTGGTGFVGGALVRALLRRGDRVTVLSRNVDKARAQVPRQARVAAWQPGKPGAWTDELSVVDAVVHLAGAPVATRWSPKYKKLIESSRDDTTRHLVEAIGAQSNKPAVLVSASATGFYGASRKERLDEDAEPGSDFLAKVCVGWEEAVRAVSEHGVRNAQLRIGVVLGPGGGALARMVLPLRSMVGGPIGKGDNKMSWVHIDDVVGMLLWAVDDDNVSGPINCTSPYVTTGKEMAKTIGSVINRPAVGTPTAVMRMVLGEAVDVIIGSQEIYPQRAIDGEYEFQHARLVPALEASLMAD